MIFTFQYGSDCYEQEAQQCREDSVFHGLGASFVHFFGKIGLVALLRATV